MEEYMTKSCELCKEPIDCDATVCKHCQSHQDWWVRHFANIGVIVSIGALMVSFLQLQDAHTESQLAQGLKEEVENRELELHNIKQESKGSILGIENRLKQLEGNQNKIAEGNLSTSEMESLRSESSALISSIEDDASKILASLETLDCRNPPLLSDKVKIALYNNCVDKGGDRCAGANCCAHLDKSLAIQYGVCEGKPMVRIPQ